MWRVAANRQVDCVVHLFLISLELRIFTHFKLGLDICELFCFFLKLSNCLEIQGSYWSSQEE